MVSRNPCHAFVVEFRAAMPESGVKSMQRRMTSAGKTCNGSGIFSDRICVFVKNCCWFERQVFPLFLGPSRDVMWIGTETLNLADVASSLGEWTFRVLQYTSFFDRL